MHSFFAASPNPPGRERKRLDPGETSARRVPPRRALRFPRLVGMFPHGFAARSSESVLRFGSALPFAVCPAPPGRRSRWRRAETRKLLGVLCGGSPNLHTVPSPSGSPFGFGLVSFCFHYIGCSLFCQYLFVNIFSFYSVLSQNPNRLRFYPLAVFASPCVPVHGLLIIPHDARGGLFSFYPVSLLSPLDVRAVSPKLPVNG